MSYDVAVIGAGWAGFNAASVCRQAGAKVCIIEKSEIGGTCLNKGCIPTKALIQSAKAYSHLKKSSLLGLSCGQEGFSFPAIQGRKQKVVAALRHGVEFSLKGVETVTGNAHFISPDTIAVGANEIKAGAYIICTGSKPTALPFLPFDGTKVVSSDDILAFNEVPKSLLIVGGGVIGCEFASMFNAFGCAVTIAEKMPQLLPGLDKDLARKLEASFKKKGVTVHTNADAATFRMADFETVLVCVGRSPMTEGLGLDKAGVALERGRIIVDGFLRTTQPQVFAAGDCASKIMLAHYAAYQGRIAGHNALGKDLLRADNTTVPSCIFTDPEIACVGMTEEQAQAPGMEVEIKKFDFLGSGMARIMDETEGFIKILVDKPTGRVVGASLMGPKVTELVAVLGVAITHGMNARNLEETIFAHPTLSEGIHDALNRR